MSTCRAVSLFHVVKTDEHIRKETCQRSVYVRKEVSKRQAAIKEVSRGRTLQVRYVYIIKEVSFGTYC